jgi:hypothetical protein
MLVGLDDHWIMDPTGNRSAVYNNLPAGTCYMVVTARDTQGRESGPSNLVAKQVP